MYQVLPGTLVSPPIESRLSCEKKQDIGIFFARRFSLCNSKTRYANIDKFDWESKNFFREARYFSVFCATCKCYNLM